MRRTTAGSPRFASQRGNTLLESALVIQVFVLLVFGAIEFGRLIYTYNFIAYAAREGTRYASVRGNDSGHPASASAVSTYVKGEAIALKSANITVTTTWSPDNHAGSVVRVKVSYTYAPLLRFILPNSLSLASTSQTVISQ